MHKQPGIVYHSPQAIKQLQEEKLQQLLHYLQKNSPYYRELFASNHINIAEIRSLEDLISLPTTCKEDL